MPAEACVVEIDDAQPIGVDENIFRHQVGMDQAVTVGIFAIGNELSQNTVAQALEQGALLR